MELRVCHTQFIFSVQQSVVWGKEPMHTQSHRHVLTQLNTCTTPAQQYTLMYAMLQTPTGTYSTWTHTHTHTHAQRLCLHSLRRQISWAVADIMYLACHTDVTAMLLRLPESAVKYEWQSLQWIPPSATASGPSHTPTTPQWITEISCFTGPVSHSVFMPVCVSLCYFVGLLGWWEAIYHMWQWKILHPPF